jgi:hypothetical protein
MEDWRNYLFTTKPVHNKRFPICVVTANTLLQYMQSELEYMTLSI